MKCANCGAIFASGGICPRCGVDVYLYKRTKNASVKLYNKGLEQVLCRDLSGALKSLRQSITFDKFNYTARNLLGLVLYEKGQVGDALKEWIISASYKKEDNIANDYIDKLQNKARDMDIQNDAVRYCNQAKRYLTQGSGDLAMIQLKKAIDLNPKLLDAHNIMALCYLHNNQMDLAMKSIQIVLKSDAVNPIALGYKALIEPAKVKTVKEEESSAKRRTPPQKERFFYKNYGVASPVIGKSEIIAFFIGIICTAGVLMILAFPAISEGKDKKITELTAQLAQLSGGAPIDEASMPAELVKLRDENKKLTAEVKKYKDSANLQERVSLLEEAAYALSVNDNETASLLVFDLSVEGFDDLQMAQYNTIRETAFPLAAESLFSKGKSEFLNNNYQEAKTYLEQSSSIVSTGDNIDDIIYYLGKITESNGDLANAKVYYEKIINEYPESNQFKNAQNSLNGIGQ